MSSTVVGEVPLVVESSDEVPLVWFEVTAFGGAALDPKGIEGLYRHAGLWARRGVGTRDRKALDEYLDERGASLDVNVSRDSTVITGVALKRNLADVIAITRDLLANPRFSADEFEKLARETPQLIDEVRDDDAALATRWFDYRCCPGHPYGRTALGTENSLKKIVAADAIAAWQSQCKRNNLIIGFAGDISEAEAQRHAEQILEPLEPGQRRPLNDGTWQRHPGIRTTIVDKPARTQAQLRIGHLSNVVGLEDAAPLAVVEAALGGMFSSRLMQEIRVKRGWSYGAGCGFRRSRLSHWFECWMATGIEVAPQAVRLTRDILRDFVENGPSDEEIELARSYLVGALPFQRASARQRLQLATRDLVLGLPANATALQAEAVSKVDNQAIRQACVKFIFPDDLVNVLVTTASDVRDTIGLGHLMRVNATDY